MARAPANCHQQNLGNLLAVVTLSNLFLANVKARIATWPTRSFSHTIPQKNPPNVQFRCFPSLISTLVRPRQVQPESADLIVGFWLPDLESDYLELIQENAKHEAKMEQRWSEVNKFRPWKPAEKVLYSMLHLQWKLRVTPVAPPWGSLSRIIRTHEPGPASDGCNEVWNPSAPRGSTHEIYFKFHEISSKPRGSTVRWLLWRWPCQAKSDPLRCTASGLSQMPVPCGNTSSQANLPGISCSEPTAARFSVPASKPKKTKKPLNFLKKKQQHEKLRIWVISAFSGHEVKWVKCQISTEGGARTWAWNSW